jgi:dTDP-4-amino-4,6-dideoxygalactose transaminase
MRGTGNPRLEAIGYGRQFVDQDDIDAVVEVLRGERLTQGPVLPRFEGRIAHWTGAPHAVAVCNGSAALHLAYLALGVKSGTRVLTSANTFVATATAALLCGGDVEFLDIDPRSANLDLDALEGRLQSGPPPEVVTAVHFAGLPCDMERLIELKQRYGFKLVEDAAHALGARYKVGGRWFRVGEHPEVDASILSFHAVKHITTGEGGAVLVQDPELDARLRCLREHGRDTDVLRGHGPPWSAPMVELGVNARLSDIHAALGISQFAKLGDFLEARREIAQRYIAELPEYEILDPGNGNHSRHAWHLFVIRADASARDDLMLHLRERGIHTQVHYDPVPLQPWFRERMGEARFPHASNHAQRSISLPIYPSLTEADQARVIESLHEWRHGRAAA